MNKTVLVTGGAGYIGSACVDSLVKAGHQVVVFDDLSTGQVDKLPAEVEFVEGSITDVEAVNKVCGSRKFDTVIHFAAKKVVGESEIDPSLYFDTNVIGSFNILSAMERFAIPQIIFSSTAAVYAPLFTGGHVDEASSLAPMSVYGVTKLMVEDMIRAYARTGKIKQFSIFRYFNVAGDVGLNYKEKKAQNVFPIITSKLYNNDTFEIFGTDYNTKDGTCVRDYIHLSDLVEAHVLAQISKKSGVYNLGTGIGYSVRELLGAFNKVSGKTMQVQESERRVGDLSIMLADAGLARKQLGWQPKHSLLSMVEDTLEVYKS
jgi:UDP-glucose 4-epimerase